MNNDFDICEKIHVAREWAEDCEWIDGELIPEMPDIEILRCVEHHYVGGLRQLLQDAGSYAYVEVQR